jgi:nucleotide-binding universal stress UspA family protein
VHHCEDCPTTDKFMPYSKVLVPVSGGTADAEAVKLACGLVRRAKGKVFVAYVIAVKRSLPLDASIEPELTKGEEALKAAEAIAETEEMDVETQLLQARDVGPALVDEAVERVIDAIVLGLPYKKRFGEFSLGSVAPYLLKNAPCPVLLLRVPASLEAGAS